MARHSHLNWLSHSESIDIHWLLWNWFAPKKLIDSGRPTFRNRRNIPFIDVGAMPEERPLTALAGAVAGAVAGAATGVARALRGSGVEICWNCSKWSTAYTVLSLLRGEQRWREKES
jgi:hypothetical protein